MLVSIGVYELVLLMLLISLAALTRETAAIILAFFAAINFDSIIHPTASNSKSISPRITLAILFICFITIYIGLRLWLGTGDSVFQKFRLIQNFTQNFSVVGGVFFISSVILALLSERGKRTTILFLITSAPYWLAMFIIANPREIRLWIPVLLPILLIKIRGDSPVQSSK